MSENNHEELFKTTLMGGFDKDDVMTKVQNLKDQAYAAQKKLEAKIEENEQEIEKLNRKIIKAVLESFKIVLVGEYRYII